MTDAKMGLVAKVRESAGRIPTPVLIFLFAFSLFGLSTSNVLSGYEGPMFRNAQRGFNFASWEPSVAGVGETALHMPVAFLVHLIPGHRLQSIQDLLPGLTQPLVTSVLCVFFYLLAMRIYRDRCVGVVLTIILACATMIWPYSKFGMENAQTMGMLALLLGFYWYLDEPGWKPTVLIGLASGFLVMTKLTATLHVGLFGLAFVVMLFVGRVGNVGRTLTHGVSAAAIMLFGLLIVRLTNSARYGNEGSIVSGRYNVSSELSSEHFWNSLFGALFSPGKSIFVFSPILIVAAFLIPIFASRDRRNLALLLIPSAVLVFVYCITSRYFIEETWGPRRLHWLVPFMLLPLGIMIQRWSDFEKWKRAAAILILVVSIGYQLVGVSFNYTYHTFALAYSPQYSLTQITWNPKMNAARFHVHQMKSAMSRARGDGSIPYVVDEYFVPWHEPEVLPGPAVFELDGMDHWDFWWAQHAAKFGGARAFFTQASSGFLWLWLLGLGFSCLLLGRRLRCRSDSDRS